MGENKTGGAYRCGEPIVNAGGEVTSAQLNRIEAMLVRLTGRHRRPLDKDGFSTEACGNCVSWTKEALDFTPDPMGQCTAGFPTATTMQLGRQVKRKNPKTGVIEDAIEPLMQGFTSYPAIMRKGQWCEHWMLDPTPPKEDLMGKLVEKVKAGAPEGWKPPEDGNNGREPVKPEKESA